MENQKQATSIALKAAWIFFGVAFLASCSSSGEHDLDSVAYEYAGGEVKAYQEGDSCFFSIQGEINERLENLALGGLNTLAYKQCAYRVVLLQSSGGNINVAMKIGESIRKHQLITHIHGECDSACGLIFIGGVRRTISLGTAFERESSLGFHQLKPALGLRRCLSESQINPILLSEMRGYIRKMLSKEAADTYYREMINAPCAGMDYLNPQYMLEKGIATSVEW